MANSSLTLLVATLQLLLTLFCAPPSLCTGRPLPHDRYRTLHVATALSNTQRSLRPLSTTADGPAGTLLIFHRDALSANKSNAAYEHRLIEKLARDSARVRLLQRVVEVKLGMVQTQAEFGSDVVSGMELGSGEYFTRIGVGTPAREQYMVIDTGSDVSWLQCQPCSKCYPQSDPIFNPSFSSSFSQLSCASPVCAQIDGASCRGGGCQYSVAYGDGSHTVGSLVKERLAFGSITVQNVALGCGHDNSGLFVGAAGLLGLGAGPLSFPSQLGVQTGGVFSYCLVDRESESLGSLIFGPGAVPAGATMTPMYRNPLLPTFYYVSLAGIIVGGSLAPVSSAVFGVDERGRGGVIIDSGTAVTRLHPAAYGALRSAFVARTAVLPHAPGVSIFDTCYNLVGLQAVRVPTVGFYFSNGATVMLPARNYMVPVDSLGTFCLAFAPTAASQPSIIGNMQQQHIRVSFDSATSLVGFSLNEC